MLSIRRVAGIFLLVISHLQAWDVFLSGSEGYTHYDAQDLNRVLVLMEKTTQEKGFNPYAVSQFDGHPQNSMVLGVQQNHWTFGFEAEFWVESFHQSEVPFDLENAERNYRVTCADLRSPGYTSKTLFGCIEASEVFDFLPLTLQVSYGRNFGPHFRGSAGYGAGILAGSAGIEMTANYYGAGAVPDDHVRFQVWPGINPVQKAFVDLEYLPWPWLGIDWRTGWRISGVQGLTLRNQQDSSRIFSSVFPQARDGAHMYFESFTTNPNDDKIFVGTEADARKEAEVDHTHFHLVQGDFTGWFVALKLNLYWRGL